MTIQYNYHTSQDNAYRKLLWTRPLAERKEAHAPNRVDGLIRFFTDEVRLSHHVAYGSRTTRFVKHNATAGEHCKLITIMQETNGHKTN